METWQVDEITLRRLHTGQPEARAVLACASVARRSPVDHEPGLAPESASGFLLVTGLDITQLNDLAWQPNRITFKARGFGEPRDFEINGYEMVDAAKGQVKFILP